MLRGVSRGGIWSTLLLLVGLNEGISGMLGLSNEW